MRVRLIAPLTAALVAGTIGLTATSAAAAPAPAPVAAPAAAAPATMTLTGTATDGTPFSGTFSSPRFARSGGQLTVTGVVTDLATGASQTVTTTVVGAAQATGACTILDLLLGPLHLDLLGLVVDLNQVHLVITAVPGPGNLLGNLLCAIAGLLDGPAAPGGLSALLNNLLRSLGLA